MVCCVKYLLQCVSWWGAHINDSNTLAAGSGLGRNSHDVNSTMNSTTLSCAVMFKAVQCYHFCSTMQYNAVMWSAKLCKTVQKEKKKSLLQTCPGLGARCTAISSYSLSTPLSSRSGTKSSVNSVIMFEVHHSIMASGHHSIRVSRPHSIMASGLHCVMASWFYGPSMDLVYYRTFRLP